MSYECRASSLLNWARCLPNGESCPLNVGRLVLVRVSLGRVVRNAESMNKQPILLRQGVS